MQDNILSKKKIWGFRVIAVIAAILVWLVVVNVQDPVTSKRISGIPISFKNTEVFTENSLIYEIEDDATTVTVVAYARRSDLSKITADDFTATVDFNMITEFNGAVKVDVEYTGDTSILDDYTVVTDTIRIATESVTTQVYEVHVTTVGTLEDGLTVGDIATDLTEVYVRGPISFVNDIYSVGGIVDVTGAEDTIETTLELSFYDIMGQEIDITAYGDRITVTDGTDDVTEVTVQIPILYSVEAALNFIVTGTSLVEEGFRYNGYVSSSDTVVLMGTREAVEGNKQLTIKSELLDVTGANSDIVVQIDLNDYIPSGVMVNGDSVIIVTLNIEELVTNSYELTFDDITLTGAETDLYEYSAARSVTLRLTGMADALLSIDASTLNARADVSELEAGTHSVLVEPTLPDGVEAEEEAYLTLVITRKETEETGD